MPAPRALAKKVDPLIVYLSFAPERFSMPVRDRITAKLRGQRGITLRERSVGVAGSVSDGVPPWGPGLPPTDVIVLYSDEYAPFCIGEDPIIVGAVNPELNYLLTAQSEKNYRLWFGIVQNSPWEDVSIEGLTLREFRELFHDLRPEFQVFREEPSNPYALDDAAATAVALLKAHKLDGCAICRDAAATSVAPSTLTPPASPDPKP